MKSKFEFRPVERTFSDPIAAQFKPGAPFGREFSRGDIVLLHPEISTSKVFLNSNVLRDAMLASKDYLEEVLEIQIKDTRKDLITEEEVQAVATAIVDEAKNRKTSVEEIVSDIVEESKEVKPAEKTSKQKKTKTKTNLILEEETLNNKE